MLSSSRCSLLLLRECLPAPAAVLRPRIHKCKCHPFGSLLHVELEPFQMRQALLVHDNPDSFDSEDLVTGLGRIGIEAHDIPKLSSTAFATVSGNPHPQWGIGRQLLFGDNSSNRFSRIWGDCDHLVSPFILVHSTYRDRVREGRTLAEYLRTLVYRANTSRSE